MRGCHCTMNCIWASDEGPAVWLGGEEVTYDLPLLQQHGIRRIVNCTTAIPFNPALPVDWFVRIEVGATSGRHIDDHAVEEVYYLAG